MMISNFHKWAIVKRCFDICFGGTKLYNYMAMLLVSQIRIQSDFNLCNLCNVKLFCLIVKFLKIIKFILGFSILHYKFEIIRYLCLNTYMCISKTYTHICVCKIWFPIWNKMNFQSFDEQNGFGKGNEHFANNCFLESL
jgi:hypothetical protein